jgi:two-component system, chemotaxis family, sensor kinase CheA
MSTLLDAFLDEGRDLLADATSGLLELERRPGDAELLNGVFRAAHTFKGSSALFDFEALTRVVHAAEDVLDAVRNGQLALDADVVDGVMAALDLAGEWLAAIQADGALPHAAESRGQERIRALRGVLGGDAAAPEEADAPAASLGEAPAWAAAFASAARERLASHDAATTATLMRYTPDGGSFFRGEDPLGLMRRVPELAALSFEREGEWPAIEDLDEYDCALTFSLLSTGDPEQLDDLFRYVADEVQVYRATLAEVAELTAPLPEAVMLVLSAQRAALAAPCPEDQEQSRVAAIAASVRGALASAGLADAQEALDVPERGALTAFVDQLLGVTPETIDEAPAVTDEVPAERAQVASRTIKVDQAKVDELLNLVGELVVAKNALPFLARQAEEADDPRAVARLIKDHHATTTRIVEELQEAAMGMRMLPVSTVFGRFPRLVRDIARKLGKDVRFVTEGDETAADKDVLEQIADPMVHLVRNSLDHGLEAPAARTAAGKPAEGTLTLRAEQEADGVLIEIVDDGAGIDPERMREAALAKGVIGPEEAAAMSDFDAVNLIFAPGFSTAAEISDLSGRGVGMDAVRSTIERLGGSIRVVSSVGEGTTVQLRLPLSMAVSQLMVVTVAGQRFGVPVEMVRETVRVSQGDIQHIGRQPAIARRGAVVPVSDLAELLALPRDGDDSGDGDLRVLVVRQFGREVGLVVDRFDDNLDVIVKPLEGILAGSTGLAGTALLGDGQVLLVLDIKELFSHAAQAR